MYKQECGLRPVRERLHGHSLWQLRRLPRGQLRLRGHMPPLRRRHIHRLQWRHRLRRLSRGPLFDHQCHQRDPLRALPPRHVRQRQRRVDLPRVRGPHHPHRRAVRGLREPDRARGLHAAPHLVRSWLLHQPHLRSHRRSCVRTMRCVVRRRLLLRPAQQHAHPRGHGAVTRYQPCGQT